ncbi:MAG: CoA protein activase [Peptococcaceae bacterium]|jgi:predicted nucleotide-binding protein (sugar kinase/HSP70/actin superfamily)|nr:CoA protein activase [Peptococcaceae bacterium]
MFKVTFPRMGQSYLAFQMLMNDLGHEVVLPPRPSKQTLDLGVRYAPEFACLPLKILLGTYLEALGAGADTVVTTGGIGPCRAGLYAGLHERILADLGYRMRMIVLEPPRWRPLEFIRQLRLLNQAHLSLRAYWEVIKKGWGKLRALDNLEKLSHQVRPREIRQGDTNRAYARAVSMMSEAYTPAAILEAEAAAAALLRAVPQDPVRPTVKVGIVGEIYVLLEPAANLEIEETLGHLGVEVERSMFLTGWTRDNTWTETTHGLTVREAAIPYLPELIGGHGRDSLGHTVLYAKRGFDGVIQLAPFSCIPEIVARTILPRVSSDWNIPVLTFFLDEQTAKAGMTTRLEAFVDLLQRKKELWRETTPAPPKGRYFT